MAKSTRVRRNIVRNFKQHPSNHRLRQLSLLSAEELAKLQLPSARPLPKDGSPSCETNGASKVDSSEEDWRQDELPFIWSSERKEQS